MQGFDHIGNSNMWLSESPLCREGNESIKPREEVASSVGEEATSG